MTHPWATLNAALNATSAVCLLAGVAAIRRKRQALHVVWMLAACTVSLVFLISYVLYHLRVGSVRYRGDGWWRVLYFTILISHAALAVAIVPVVVRVLQLAKTQRFDMHRRLARRLFPVWLYVSLTGVVVYLMLYHA